MRVHAVLTGPTDTDMNRGLDIPKASRSPSCEPSSTAWRRGRRTSSRIPCQRPWRRAGAGTDVVHYLSETQGFSTFARDGGTVCHSYSTGARGVEFLIGYYPILDRVPKGRDEGDAFQTWLRLHDEYDTR